MIASGSLAVGVQVTGLCLDRSAIIEFREELPCPLFNGVLRLK